MIAFKVRNPDDISAEKRYKEEHLPRLRGNVIPDLWRYFSSDFFHDGCINNIKIDPSRGRVIMEIECPNIEHVTPGGGDFISMVFRCEFDRVFNLFVGYPISELNGFSDRSDFKYRYAEINGESEIIEKIRSKTGDEFFSIVIETSSTEEYIALIFGELRVEALEPGAFALIRYNSEFKVPLALE